MSVREALVAGVVAVVDAVADVRRVDALAARQALERRPVTARAARRRRRRRGARHPPRAVVRPAAGRAAAAAVAVSRAHRVRVVDARSSAAVDRRSVAPTAGCFFRRRARIRKVK